MLTAFDTAELQSSSQQTEEDNVGCNCAFRGETLVYGCTVGFAGSDYDEFVCEDS